MFFINYLYLVPHNLIINPKIKVVEKEDYRISFFKPTTQQALKNRNLTILLVTIWAVAVFGFQIVLKIIEKPVPEEALGKFTNAWEKYEAGNAGQADWQEMGKAMLHVMGKSTVKPEEYAVLEDGVGWVFSQLASDSVILDVQQKSQKVNTLQQEITSLKNDGFIAAKQEVVEAAAPVIGVCNKSLLANLLSLGFDDDLKNISEENKAELPAIMKLYLIHNRSVLTDTVFLGFPFHYFYTAVFLLILFVGLCWLYCYRTDKVHAKLNVVEQHD